MRNRESWKPIREFVTWVFVYGFIMMNLATQIIYLAINFFAYMLCSANCSSIMESYFRYAPERLLFGSIFGLIVGFVIFLVSYWRNRSK